MKASWLCTSVLFLLVSKVLSFADVLTSEVQSDRQLSERTAEENGGKIILLSQRKTSEDTEHGLAPVDTSKRSWFGALATGVSFASLGLSFSTALTDGCVYYPSICRDKKAIERMEGQLRTMRDEFKTLFLQNKKDYYDMNTANSNNAYISFYTNETIRSLQTIEDLETALAGQLETKFPKLFEMAQAAENYTYDEYLENVVGRLEFRLSDIKNMLRRQKRTQLLMLAGQVLVTTTAKLFVKGYKYAHKHIKGKIILGKILKAHLTGKPVTPKLKFQFSTWKNIKLAPRVFKHMFQVAKGKVIAGVKSFPQKIKLTLKNIGSSIKNFNLKNFRQQVASKFRAGFQKIKKFGSFLKQKAFNMFRGNKSGALSSTKKGTGTGMWGNLGKGLGIILDVGSQVLSAIQYKKIADQLQSSRRNYEEHVKSLSKEIEHVKAQKEIFLTGWKDVISAFKSCTDIIRNLIKQAKEFDKFDNVLGVPKLPVNTTSPVFSIDFNKLNSKNLLSIQASVIQFMKDEDNEIVRLVDEMRAKKILYENVREMTDDGDSINDILQTVTKIFKFDKSPVVQKIGQTLALKDTVCTISILRIDKTSYNFFPLEPFRPTCKVNTTLFDQMKRTASRLQLENLMRKVIVDGVSQNKKESLSDLADDVRKAYSVQNDPKLSSFAHNITDLDVICIISKEFPEKKKFDFINLMPFRPDCSSVDKADFNQMKLKASKIRTTMLQIDSTLQMCDQYKLCPCLKMMASMNGLSDDEVKDLIKLRRPDMKEYCGMGCGCVTL